MTVVDISLQGLAAGRYRVTIREFGDVKHGAASTGRVWARTGRGELQSAIVDTPCGVLGDVEVGANGQGGIFLDANFQVWEVIGRALVVSRHERPLDAPLGNDEHTVVGVIARSAGIWDNDKTVCSCTGKTLWEEREHEVRQKGML